VSEAFLAQAQRLTKTGSLRWKPSTGEIVWSDGNYDLMGYPVGTTPTVELALARCHPEDVARVQEVLGRAVREGSGVEFEHRLLMPEGTVKHVRVVWENVATADDPEFLGAATDISAWKESEERLRRSEAYLAEAQRLSATGNFGWRVGDEHLVWSDETFRIFAVDPATPVTRQSVLDLVHPDGRGRGRTAHESRPRRGATVDHEYRIRTPGGLVKYVHWSRTASGTATAGGRSWEWFRTSRRSGARRRRSAGSGRSSRTSPGSRASGA
jgi:PAS domain-containing protein